MAGRPVLRRLRRAPRPAAAGLGVLRRPEPLRDGPVQDRRPGGRRRDEPRGAHRRHVLAELRPVLHRPHPALHGRGGLRAQVHPCDEPQPGALRRHPADLRHLRARRRPELPGAQPGLRDRAERRLARHHQHVGDHHDLPRDLRAPGPRGPGDPAALPAEVLPAHRDRHHRLPAGLPRHDVGRPRGRPQDPAAHPGDRRHAGRRLVRRPPPGERRRRPGTLRAGEVAARGHCRWPPPWWRHAGDHVRPG
ncbi:hypothetical protein SGPA1_10305 [Streptomyces misionensis JCM 4497]